MSGRESSLGTASSLEEGDMYLEVSTRIERPPNDVFEFVAVNHFRNHPRWDPNVVEMTPTSRGRWRLEARCR